MQNFGSFLQGARESAKNVGNWDESQPHTIEIKGIKPEETKKGWYVLKLEFVTVAGPQINKQGKKTYCLDEKFAPEARAIAGAELQDILDYFNVPYDLTQINSNFDFEILLRRALDNQGKQLNMFAKKNDKTGYTDFKLQLKKPENQQQTFANITPQPQYDNVPNQQQQVVQNQQVQNVPVQQNQQVPPQAAPPQYFAPPPPVVTNQQVPQTNNTENNNN